MFISIWVVFAYMMADVMPRGHGGDGAGDSPPRDGFGRGSHEQDRKYNYKYKSKFTILFHLLLQLTHHFYL